MVVFTLAGIFVTSVVAKVIIAAVNGAFIVGGATAAGVVIYRTRYDEKGHETKVPCEKVDEGVDSIFTQ